MANNVKFLTGTQAKLDGLSTFTPGAFYLTSDSDRLYFGKSSSELALLNKTIIHVAAVEALPKSNTSTVTIGDFYYAKKENVLCTWDGSGWVQINSDTNTNDIVEGLTWETTSDADSIDINGKILIQKYERGIKKNSHTVKTVITITEKDIAKVISAGVVSAAGDSNSAFVKLEGTGFTNTNASGVKISGDGSITVTGSDKGIVINGVNTNSTYTLNNNSSTTVTLKEDDTSNKGTVTFNTDTENDSLAVAATDGNITYKHKTFSAPTESTNTPAQLKFGGTLDAITAVTDDNGHLTGYTKTTYKLPANIDTKYEISKVSATSDGKVNVSYKTNGGAEKTVSGGEISYKVEGAKCLNQAELPVYNKTTIDTKLSNIDKKINELNAMVYRGVVGGEGNLPALPVPSEENPVKIGDSYLVGADGQYGGHTCVIGDFLIANSKNKENAEGKIVSGDILWDLVPAGNDIEKDTTYTLQGSGDKINLYNNASKKVTSSVTVQDDNNDISATVSNNILKIEHLPSSKDDGKDVIVSTTNTSTLTHNGSLQIIDKIQRDTNGHVTDVTTKTLTLPGDNNTTYTLPVNSSNTVTLQPSSGNADSVTFKVGTSNQDLEVSSTATSKHKGEITYKHKDYNSFNGESGITDKTISAGSSFDIIKKVNLSNGHVTGLETAKITLPVDNNATYSLSGITTAAKTGGANLTVNLTGANGGADSSATMSFTSKNSNLVITPGTKSVEMNLVWETF